MLDTEEAQLDMHPSHKTLLESMTPKDKTPYEFLQNAIKKLYSREKAQEVMTEVAPGLATARQMVNESHDLGITAELERQLQQKTGKTFTETVGKPRGLEEMTPETTPLQPSQTDPLKNSGNK